jgi:hypothetical protein
MIFLFRSGTYVLAPSSFANHPTDKPPSFRSKCWLVYKATRQHARNLGLFALVYKTSMLFLKHTSPTGKERHYDAFLAGLLGGYTVFGRTIHNSVSQQIVIYVFARVALALAKLAVQPKNVAGTPGGGGGWEVFGDGEMRRTMIRNGWPAFASLSWAMVMYLFRWHPETVQSSLRSSMSYMWVFGVFLLGEVANEMQLRTVRSLGLVTDVALAQQIRVAGGRWALGRCLRVRVILGTFSRDIGTPRRFRLVMAFKSNIGSNPRLLNRATFSHNLTGCQMCEWQRSFSCRHRQK